MDVKDFEELLLRSARLTFSMKKFMITYLTLVACGILFVFAKVISLNASSWVQVSLIFIPFLISMGVLLSLGTVLNRLYLAEVKGRILSLKEAVLKSLKTIVATSYFVVPVFFSFLLLWLFLGFFYLIKELPGVGEFFSVILVFAPYVLILASLLLSFSSIFLLFHLTPLVSFKANTSILTRLIALFKDHLFLSIGFFLLAILPVVIIGAILLSGAVLTSNMFINTIHPVIVGLKWFFLMLPFTAFLTPFVNFFFNMSVEAYSYLEKRSTSSF